MNNQTHIVISGQFAVGCAVLLIAYVFYCVLHATNTPQSAADTEAEDNDDGHDLLGIVVATTKCVASIIASAAMAHATKKLFAKTLSMWGDRMERRRREHHDVQRKLVCDKMQRDLDEASKADKERKEMAKQEEKKKIELPELCRGIDDIGLTEEYPHDLKMDDQVDDDDDAPGLVNSSFALDDEEEVGGEVGGESGTAMDGQAIGCIIL